MKHNMMDCPREDVIEMTFTVAGDKQRIAVHHCCPNCGQRVARRRWGKAEFTVLALEGVFSECAYVNHVRANCRKCGDVYMEATYAE